jgi:hypothetical protein
MVIILNRAASRTRGAGNGGDRKETRMFRRLQSMIAWNAHYRVDNDRYATYYGSLAARNYKRGEARRDIDAAMYRMPIRM